MKYKITEEPDFFLNAKNFLHQLTVVLKSSKWLHAEHGEVETLIQKDGFEILRLLFQGHLDERAKTEIDLSSEAMDRSGRPYTRENCSRQLNSVFGTVEVRRKGYSDKGRDSVFPQHAELNLSRDSYSDGLRMKAAYSVSDLSFEKSTETILKSTASSIPKRQIENVIRHLSQDFDSFYASQEIDTRRQAGILVLSCDGKGIIMRQADLREATQKAAAIAVHKKQTRLSRGEKRNRKRMAMVAAVYDIDPHMRSARSIMGLDEKESVPPKPRHKRVWASVEKPGVEVIRDMFLETLRRDPKQKHQWVILVDGHAAQLAAIKKVMKSFKIQGAAIVMDFVHVLEYLWKAAYCFHPETSQKAEKWVMERALKVLSGEAGLVAGGIRRSCTMLGLSKKNRENADKCADYLLRKKAYLRYDSCLDMGYPIATGVIEGTCRYLVKDRLDITGARWSLKGAEAVLKIRALKSSNDIEEYFKFHKLQDRERNYPYFEAISHKKAA